MSSPRPVESTVLERYQVPFDCFLFCFKHFSINKYKYVDKSAFIQQIVGKLYFEFLILCAELFKFYFVSSLKQDDMLDEDRLMLDRSPDEMGSHGNDMDELCGSDSDLDDDANETTTDGERVIYPWMKKIHVAGVGKLNLFSSLSYHSNHVKIFV